MERFVDMKGIMAVFNVSDRKTIKSYVDRGMPVMKLSRRTHRYDVIECKEWAKNTDFGKIDPKTPAPKSDIEKEIDELLMKAVKRNETGYTEDYEAFWSSYPRKLRKKATYTSWKANLKAGKKASDMIRAAQNYAALCKRKRTEEGYILHPSTFLNKDRFEDYLGKGDGPDGGERLSGRGASAERNEVDALSL